MQRTTLKPVILYFSSVLVEEQVLYNAASHEYSKIMSHTLRNLASNINHKICYKKIYLAFAFFHLPLSSQAFRSYLQIFLTSAPNRNWCYLNGRNETPSISPSLLHFEFQILFKELYLCNFYNPCTELWMRTVCVYQIQFKHWMCIAIRRGSKPPCKSGLVPLLWRSLFLGECILTKPSTSGQIHHSHQKLRECFQKQLKLTKDYGTSE